MNRGSCEHVYLGAPVKGFIISEPSGLRKSRPVDLCEKCYALVNDKTLREPGDRRAVKRGR